MKIPTNWNNILTKWSFIFWFNYLFYDMDTDQKNDEDHESYSCLWCHGCIIQEIITGAVPRIVVVSTNFCPTLVPLIVITRTCWKVQSFNIESKKHWHKDSDNPHHLVRTLICSDAKLFTGLVLLLHLTHNKIIPFLGWFLGLCNIPSIVSICSL